MLTFITSMYIMMDRQNIYSVQNYKPHLGNRSPRDITSGKDYMRVAKRNRELCLWPKVI